MKPTRLFELLAYQQENYPQDDALVGKYDGSWKKFSTQEVIDESDRLAVGLLNLGLKKGDMIAIISPTQMEWIVADQAIMKMGGVNVPLYPTSAEKDLQFILNHSEVKLVFAYDDELYNKIKQIQSDVPSLQHIYTFREVEAANNYSEIKNDISESDISRLKEIQDGINKDELATIIYTSGTTGDPKGVMLSHWNILSNLIDTKDVLPVGQEHIALSFLPLCHSFERMINYLYLYAGISIYYAENMETIGDNLREIRPHVFTAVPRLLEKVFDKIMAKGEATRGIKRKLFFWAVDLGMIWKPDGQNGFWYEFKLKIADIVFKKWREALGDRVIALASGSAALQPRLMRIFNAAGIPLVEGYGLTETSPVISVGHFTPGNLKCGTVGKVIEHGVVKIAEDGEILFKGPNLMLGYYKRDDITKEVIDGDGWFHTGDIGNLDKEGFLKITDRKKEIFKTSGGKYIAPQPMENKFKESVFIEQVMVVGEYQKFPGALIVPNFAHIKEWLSGKGKQISETSKKDILKMQEVQEAIEQEMARLNEGYAQYEKVKKYALVEDEWTPDNGLVTPTLKLKRKVLMQKYKPELARIYDV